MKANPKIVAGSVAALILLIINLKHYELIGGSELSGTTNNKDVAPALTHEIGTQSLVSFDWDSLAHYRAVELKSNLFEQHISLTNAELQEIEQDAKLEVIETPEQPEETALTPGDITVLAMSEHGNGVRALVRYRGKQLAVSVNDIIDNTYRVKAITAHSLLLTTLD
jgi:hypothetical protein